MRIAIILTAVTFGLAPSPAEAHPFHFSFAEAQWNAETESLEIALRVESKELEPALRTRQRPKFNLDDDSAGQVVAAYLREHLQFTRGKEKPVEWKWIGMEVKVKETWCYLEVPLAGGPEGITITNTILLAQIPEQVNVMSIAAGDRRQRLHFNANSPRQVVKLESKPDQ